jgi:hypothetical protein
MQQVQRVQVAQNLKNTAATLLGQQGIHLQPTATLQQRLNTLLHTANRHSGHLHKDHLLKDTTATACTNRT